MAATRIEASLSLILGPPIGGTSGDGSQSVAARSTRYYAHNDRHEFVLTGAPGDTAVSLGAMTSVKTIYGRSDAPVSLKLTHAGGSLQIVPLDQVFYLETPNRPITAIALSGSAATGTLILAGD